MAALDSLRGRARRRTARALAVFALAGLGILAACRSEERLPETQRLAWAAPLPTQFAPDTQLRLGDPSVQLQLGLMGEAGALPFDVQWQNISGGPLTIEAFRAGALDGGSVGDTPPIHAHFTGLDVKIIAVDVREKPIYRLALAPGVAIRSIEELRGRRIAYSPGQAQGALVLRVLRKAGLRTSDVQLVELSGTEFRDALASRQVDAAPLGATTLARYLAEYGAEGAGSILPGVRDDLSFFYVRSAVLEDPHKAAALREYVRRRARAQRWAAEHSEQWIAAYHVKDQGLSSEQGRELIEQNGWPHQPPDWSEAIALTQETIDLLAAESGRPAFDAREIFDLRFAPGAAAPAGQRAAAVVGAGVGR